MIFQLTNDLKGNPMEYKLFFQIKTAKFCWKHKTYVLQDNKFQIKQHNEFECSNNYKSLLYRRVALRVCIYIAFSHNNIKYVNETYSSEDIYYTVRYIKIKNLIMVFHLYI